MKKYLILAALLALSLSAHAANRSILIKELQTMRSEKRVALVIGNSAYASSPLKNPVNDARLVARALKDLGFEVIAQENANLKQMMLAINDFGKRIKGGGVGLFYYAGHGMQANGRNYLIPVGAAINSESEMEFESVDAGRVLAKMEDAGNRVNIIVLDACRDNPFSRGFRSSSKGLAQISAPEGSYIAYAAKPGMVASDGSGNNSVFTEAFVKAIKEDDLEINDVFRQVRSEVIKRTDKKQVPHTEETVTGHFYFKVPKGDAGAQDTAGVNEAPAPATPKTDKKVKKDKKAMQVAKADPSPASRSKEYLYQGEKISLTPAMVFDIADKVESAQVIITEPDGGYGVSVVLKEKARQELKEFSEKNIGQRVGMIFKEKLVIVAVMREPMSGGAFRITGRYTPAEAKKLASELTGK